MKKVRKCFLWFPIRFEKAEILSSGNDLILQITQGFFNVKINKIPLYRIVDIGYTRSFLQFFFGVSNVSIYSTDPSTVKDNKTASKIELCKIRRGKKFMKTLEELVASERDKNNVKYNETEII